MSINNSPEADIYVPMTREEAASNNYIMNTDQTNNTNNQNDDEIEQSNSGSNMISNVLNEVNTFIDSLDSPPLFAPPASSLPSTTTATNAAGCKNYKDGAGEGAPKTNINDMLPPPPSYEAATSSYSIADELNNLHIDRIHSDHGTGVECNVCPPSSLTSLTPPQTSSTTITTASTQPQTALTKAEDNDKEDGGMINKSEELFTSLSSRYQQQQEDQQQQVKADSFEDDNHIGNVVIGTSTTKSEESIDVAKASEELYNKILQEEQQQQQQQQQKQEEINLQNKTAAAVLKKEIEHNIQEREDIIGNDEVSEITKASEELYNKINSNINSSDSITAMESYSVGGESIDISVTATTRNNNEKAAAFNWNREVPRSQRRSSSSSYRQISASSFTATAAVLPPSVSSEQVQKKNTATTSTSTDDQVVDEKSQDNKVHEPSTNLQPSSNLQPRVANPTEKVLSPFSSKARRVIRTLQTIKDEAQSSNNERFGLQNCRRVSLLLKVSSHSQQQENVGAGKAGRGEETDEDGYGPILYPALIDQEAATADGREGEEVKSSSQLMKHGEVILVNPNAFDAEEDDGMNKGGSEKAKTKKRIAGRVTVETAKLVAEVSQISSEDWARKYQFDDVSWPHHCKSFPSSSTQASDDSHSTMSALASAAVQDVLSLACQMKQGDGVEKDNYIPCSTVICTVGGSASGKTLTIFGPTIAGFAASRTPTNVNQFAESHDLGLFGDIINGILSSQHASVQCSISILEIVNDDVLRDVLGFSEDGLSEQCGTKALRVCHLDNRGAIVSNLHEESIKSMDQLHQLLEAAFKSKPLRRLWNKEGGHGHFIATITVSSSKGECAKIQLVDVASPDRQGMQGTTSGSVRKSLSALRGVLRGIVVKNTSSPIPYRESTLTKLLQRSLEGGQGGGNDNVSTPRAVVIGTVSPSGASYNQTLSTMDFMTRLLAKTGDTARSPFPQKAAVQSVSNERASSDGNKKHDAARQHSPKPKSSIASHSAKVSLKSITADPRQRLAKLLNPAKPIVRTKDVTPKVDEANTPTRSISIFSEEGKGPSVNYGGVFDQLDSLMTLDDDGVDRNSYGDEILEGLTPYKASRPDNEGGSVDSSEGMLSPNPSPFRVKRVNDVGLDKVEEKKTPGIQRLLHKPSLESDDAPSSGLSRNLFEVSDFAVVGSSRKAPRPVQKANILRKSHTPVKSRVPKSLPKSLPKQGIQKDQNVSRHNKSTHAAERSNVPLLNRLLSQDSMSSDEPLVSSSSQHGNNTSPPPVNSVDIPKSPTFDMLESFKNEVDTLVTNLTSPNHNALSEEDVQQLPNKLRIEKRNNQSDKKSSVFENELASLKARVQTLTDEKASSEVFLSRIQSMMTDYDCIDTLADVPSLWPVQYLTVEDAIRKRQSLVVNLQSQLEMSHAESEKLSRDLDHAENKVSELSQEVKYTQNDLVTAKEAIQSQAQSSSSLESDIKRLKEQLKDLNIKNKTSSNFLGQLDAALGISNTNVSACDETEQHNRLDSIESLQTKLRQGLKKLEESMQREQLAKSKADEFKLELDNQTRISQGSQSRMEAKRLETEKLAEEAISANETLTNEVASLQNELMLIKNEHETLLATHNSALGNSEQLSNEYVKTKSQIVERDEEISRLNRSFLTIRDEKTKLEGQLSSIKTKTVEVMKERIEMLRSDYARRLEDVKAEYSMEKDESDITSRIKLELSAKETENANLRRRMEQIEKSTSLKVQNAQEKLNQVQRECNLATQDASTQREENKAIQNELTQLRSLMDIAEESVGELNRLKEENKQLNDTIKSHSQNDHISRMSSVDVPVSFEIKGGRYTHNDSSGYNDGDHFMHERISALMRENEQNNISMRTLQSENVALKGSIEECTKTMKLMHSEMNDLKTIATDGVSKLRLKEKTLLDEQQRDKDAIAEMERQLESLKSSRNRYYDEPSMTRPPPSINRLKTPESERGRRGTHPSSRGTDNYFATPSGERGAALSERKLQYELSTEKELRYKAEEICAGVLANSKAALEERDSEISKLRSQLYKVSNRRYDDYR